MWWKLPKHPFQWKFLELMFSITQIPWPTLLVDSPTLLTLTMSSTHINKKKQLLITKVTFIFLKPLLKFNIMKQPQNHYAPK
jgi:hypothetical protein